MSGFVSAVFQSEARALQKTFTKSYPLVDASKKKKKQQHNIVFFFLGFLKVFILKGNALTLNRLLGRTS